MAFCTGCGSQMADSARFCTHCGKQLAGGAAASYAPPVSMEPLDYTIQGDNLQLIRIRLKPGQEVYAEAGKMLYKQPQVQWETRMTGETLGEKLLGAVKRKLIDRKSTRLNSSHSQQSRMPSSA